MKKLIVNCGSAVVTKYNPKIFDGYDEILINTGSAVFSGEAYERLSQKKLMVNAGAQKILEGDYELVYLGEDARLSQNVDYSGCHLLCESLVIDPAALPGLENIAGIIAEKIYYPGSMPLSIVKKLDAEDLVAYPADAFLVREDIVLDMDFMGRLGEEKTFYTEGRLEALDAEALAAAADAGVRFICGSVYLYAGLEKAYGGILESRKRVLVPDEYRLVKAPKNPLKHLCALHGDRLYILGDLLVRTEEKAVLAGMQGLTVEGTVRLPLDLLPEFKQIGKAGDIFLYQGIYLEMTGKGTLTHEQLNAAMQSGTGFTVVVNGALEITEDVTVEDLQAVYALRYSGIIQCPGRLQPFLQPKIEEGSGHITEKNLAESMQPENGDMINLGQWVVD